MERWVGQVAVITGASSGIGASIAEELIKLGLKVVGLARRKELMDQLSVKLSNQPGKFYSIKTDITQESEILQAFAWAKANLGPVSILINSAGITTPDMLIDGNAAKWASVLDTNVLGLCVATREAVKDMRASGIDGHIIHISGVSGIYVPKLGGISIGCASKFALTALTETLRQELNSIKSRIKISCISPGVVDTDIIKGVSLNNESLKSGSMPKLNVKDIANSVLYILSTPPHVQVHQLIIRPVGEEF